MLRATWHVDFSPHNDERVGTEEAAAGVGAGRAGGRTACAARDTSAAPATWADDTPTPTAATAAAAARGGACCAAGTRGSSSSEGKGS